MTVRVLVVDEDPDTLEVLELFLEREGDRIEVTTERDPNEAVDRVGSGSIDCVVSDYRMPGLNGVELCAAVREDVSGTDVPFFLFTGVTDEATREEAEAAGVTGVVHKGAGVDHFAELAERIEAAVE